MKHWRDLWYLALPVLIILVVIFALVGVVVWAVLNVMVEGYAWFTEDKDKKNKKLYIGAIRQPVSKQERLLKEQQEGLRNDKQVENDLHVE